MKSSIKTKEKTRQCKICGHSQNYHMTGYPPHSDLIVCGKDNCTNWNRCSDDKKLKDLLTKK